MKERINRLAKGLIEYDEVQVSFSAAQIEEAVVLDDKKRGEFHVICEVGKAVKGLVYSTNQKVSLLSENFMGKDCRIIYEIDASYAEGDITGEFQVVCSGGEFRIPYHFHVCAVNPEGRQVTSLKEFTILAKENEEEALKFFESSDFVKCPFMQEAGIRVLYDGLWGRGNRQNALEEFLVGAGLKKPVLFHIKKKDRDYQAPPESFSDTLVIKRSGWGYIRLELTADTDFIQLERTAVTEQDFDGDSCTVGYTVRFDRLHAGHNWGAVQVKGIYGEETVPISVTLHSNRTWTDGPSYKKDFNNFISLDLKQWAGEYERNLLLNSMQTALSRTHATAQNPSVIRLYQAGIFLMQDKKDQALQMLEEARDAVLDNRDKDVASYCFYMYLKVRESGENVQRQTMVKLLRKYYEEGVASDMALYILMQTDQELLENDSLALSRLKEHFRKGCRSPYLYLGVCRILRKNPELLRVMEEFEIQSLWFGARYHMVEEGLAKKAALQSIQVKRCRRLCLRLLKKLYETYPSKEILTGVCAMLIRGDCRSEADFSWYAKGVEEDIHLTRLYEYYLYALPEGYDKPLPRILLLYFSYNHTLDYHAQAILYLNVLTYMKEDDEIYRAYESQIENFAVEQLFQSHMNEALAQIYSQMVFPEIIDEKIARVLPKLLYAKNIRCGNPWMRQVVLCYEEMRGETVATLRNGRAYVPVYLEDVHVMFQDDYGNRYSGIPYSMTGMMDCPKLAERTAELYPSHEMMRLLSCQQVLAKKQYYTEDIDILKDISQEENIHELYRKKLVSKIISYYYKMEETAACDEYLLSIDKKLLKAEDRFKVMDALITKDFHDEAYKMAARYGYRSLNISRILKLTSKMILKHLFEKDGLLLEMAYYCFVGGRYDDVIVEYLCCHYNGLSRPMYHVLSAALTGHITVYDMPERLLGQMLFDGVYCHLDEVFRCYIEGKSVDESLVRAYLVVKSQMYFEGNGKLDADILGYIEVQIERYEIKNGLPEICMLALTKYYSTADGLTDRQIELCQSIIDELYRKRIVFAYYKELDRFIDLPRELMGKTVIEYHGKRRQSIWIHQRLLPDGGETVIETIPHMFDGYFVKLVSLFYGETMEYEIYDDTNSSEPVMTGTAEYDGDSSRTEGNRAGRLDELLRLQASEDGNLKEKMESYSVRDEMTEKLFDYL
ncbi:DUF5717 family protein [Qiania dongpingensis]|uniref:Uncharacterized protein n=1 Tax=Qiania dongpingensis TaxID=2763669 RepID=A0A7G9G1T6_9FIRM|nr:DUF5717 family protein [Qiania dongpingensis]QNM04768.1 hypothetical protein H9Q78_09915 [Qiania dongpingensis]